MSKQYGLIHPKKDAPKFSKLSAFDSDSDSDNKESTSKKPKIDLGLIQKKQIARAHNAALAEDPTIFQYDEVFDDIKNERESAKVVKKTEQKSVKYIGKLMESADRRKKDFERRIERQVQKEREAEGEMYKDKEAFITSSYKQKLEEMKKAEEEEKRSDYLEAIGDVTKQRDMGGFYRHLWEQKMGPDDVKKTETASVPEHNVDDDKIKKPKEQVKKDRVYRKRKASGPDASDEEAEETTGADLKSPSKKAHLQSNLDADSDFSIDSDSEEESKDEPVNTVQHPTDVPTKNESKATTVTSEPQLDSKTNDEKGDGDNEPVVENETKDAIVEEHNDDTKKPKIDRKKVWEKRTVGDVLVGAIQRYFERKQMREG
ncbi:hypothetical protein HA402_005810 [Bradysia odoriphaga]|nr:hypothetical protein HA402_005810 [Bradysia odoriphaga]